MIDFSKKRLARAKEENIDVKQLAVAELLCWGWDAVDAMLAVGVLKSSDDKDIADHMALSYTSDANFLKLAKKRASQLRNGSVLDEYQKIHPTPGSGRYNSGRPRSDGGTKKAWEAPAAEAATDEEILSAMWETIGKLDPADPKRVDLLDKYDKLKRRQGGGEDDTTIHFYLPRPECDTCPFRGNHVITEPEPTEEKNPEDDFKEAKELNLPKPKKKRTGETRGRKRKPIIEDAQGMKLVSISSEEPIQLIGLDEEF